VYRYQANFSCIDALTQKGAKISVKICKFPKSSPLGSFVVTFPPKWKFLSFGKVEEIALSELSN
jgi:hypothetical protein